MKKKYENGSTIELARHIQRRPLMYMQKVSLSELELLLSYHDRYCEKADVPPWDFFYDFIRYKLQSQNHNVILDHCKGDEEAAFHKFYEFLDEYVCQFPKAIYKADLTDDNFELYYSKAHINKPYRCLNFNLNARILYPAPYHIKLMEFEFATYVFHYDFHYMLKETKSGLWQCGPFYSNVRTAKKEINKRFGKLTWKKEKEEKIKEEFETILLNCIQD